MAYSVKIGSSHIMEERARSCCNRSPNFMPSSVASNIKYHAEFTPCFSPFTF
jgi:hypothetical protein